MGHVIRSSDTTAINGIRQLVSVNLNSGLLPDSTIDSPVFIRAAEFHVYRLLGFITDDSSSVDADAKYEQRVGLSSSILQFPRNQFPVTFNYQNQYQANTSYNVNDIVYDGTDLYYANKFIRNSSSNLNQSDWDQINVSFKGDYQYQGTYRKNDIVYSSGLYYANKEINSAPGTLANSDWEKIESITQTAAQKQSEERIKIAVQYQAAIRLILSMPQLLEEQILRERVRFQEINWEKRIEFYESETTDAIEPEVPDGTIFSDATAIFGEVKQFVAF